MPISIDWNTLVITIPQSYTTFISGTLYELDTEQFRNDIRAIEASTVGMAFLDAIDHNTQYTVAGITYARKIEIINGYTLTFEDGQYAVRLAGSNNNLFDEGIINRNQVSIIPTNSAGLILGPTSVAPTLVEIVNGVWDELLTGTSHNIKNSAGKRLRDLAANVIHTDTAQGPAANGNQIQLALAASTVDGTYDPALIFIRDGTGVGQARLILEYDGASRTATVDRDWRVVPDATSEYVIVADPGREHVNEGLAQGGATSTITLNSQASAIDDAYLYQVVFIRSGLGSDQIGIITAYNGTTKVATIDGSWATVPDTTSAYVLLPSHNNVTAEQFAAYAGEITIDVANGSAGTAYPAGTKGSPVNNLADAKVLGAFYGIEVFHIQGMLTIGASDVIDGLVFEGHNEIADTIILTAGCSTENTVFKSMRLTGTFGGGVFVERCALSAAIGIGSDTNPSLFDECVLLEGTHGLRSGLTTPQNIQMVDCVSGVSTGAGTTFDINGAASRIAFRKYGGIITLTNCSNASETVELEMDQGAVTLAASCTAGNITVRGLGELTDNSAGSTVVDELVKSSIINKTVALAKALLGLS